MTQDYNTLVSDSVAKLWQIRDYAEMLARGKNGYGQDLTDVDKTFFKNAMKALSDGIDANKHDLFHPVEGAPVETQVTETTTGQDGETITTTRTVMQAVPLTPVQQILKDVGVLIDTPPAQ